MRLDRARRGWLEGLTLLVAVGVAAAVGWAAVVPFGDPVELGRASHVARVAALEAAVVARWERVARSGEALLSAPGVFEWLPAGGRAEVRPSEGRASAVFEALLAEALVAERGGEAERARGLVETALHTAASDREAANAALRLVQFEVRAADAERAAAAWRAVRPALSGGGIGLAADARLLAGLAAAPALDRPERAALQRELVEAWEEGTLALPVVTLEAGSSDLRALLRAEMLALADGVAPAERVARAEARARGAQLETRTASALPDEHAALVALDVGEARLWLDPRAEPLPLAAFDADETLAAEIARRIAAELPLPADASLALVRSPQANSATRLGRPLALAGTPYHAELVHPDPAALARAAGAPFSLARTALVASAAAILAAGALAARSLARSRRLAELRTQFVAGVSHELRTPLAALLLLAENLARGGIDDSDRRATYHAALVREALRLRRIVDDVLDFSRLERGRPLEVDRSPIAAGRLVEEIEGDAARVLGERGITLATRGGDALPADLDIDAGAVRRAVANLVDNAARHADARSVAIHWSIAADGTLCVAVEDDGRGLASNRRERLFLPFERGRGAHPSGSGLGLAIVRAIARAHGGEAAATVAVGGGARFELTFARAALSSALQP